MQTLTQRLLRSRTDKMLAGVAGGIGNYFGIDPVIVRLVFVVMIFSGFSLIIYPILWIVMPLEPENTSPIPSDPTGTAGDVVFTTGNRTQQARFDPMTGQPLTLEQEIPIQNIDTPASADDIQNRRNWALGLLLLGIGIFLVLSIIVPLPLKPFLIPILLIIGGIWLLYRTK